MVSYLLGLEKMMKADLVLILIVVEDGLVLIRSDNGEHMLISLNPYCSGRWSRTNKMLNGESYGTPVLILIVVEDCLVHEQGASSNAIVSVLILIVVEDGLVLMHEQGASSNAIVS